MSDEAQRTTDAVRCVVCGGRMVSYRYASGLGQIHPACWFSDGRKRLPAWDVSVTLVGFGPNSDRNKRILRHRNHVVATFNERMAEWHPGDDAALHALCRYLNEQETADA